jgi:Spy/CpxP family protein refolding chaperone
MNKLAITVISTLLLFASGLAFSQDAPPGPGKKAPHHGPQPMPLIADTMRALRRLDLSEEQKVNVKTIVDSLKENIKPVMLEMRPGHEQLKELTVAEVYDADAVKAAAEKEGDLLAQRIILTSEALFNIRAQLTAEQRTQLDEMAAKRQGHRAHKGKPQKGKRGGKDEPPPTEG